MPNYTTADDIAASGEDGSMWTTVDGTPLLSAGWRPGKKHSILQNIARVASFGGYNPDNREASAINKQILQQHGLNQEQFAKVRQAHAEEIEQKTNDIMSWDPNIPRPEARNLAIEMFTTQYFAELAANKANIEQEGVRAEEMAGRKPGSRAFGEAAVGADTEASRARLEQMKNVGRGAAAQGKLMVPESQAKVASGTAVNQNMQLQDQLGDIQDRRLQSIALKPLMDRRALAEAAQAATTAEASNRIYGSDADRLERQRLNKMFNLSVSPWGENYVPYPEAYGTSIEGREKPVGSQINEYKTTTRRFDEANRPIGYEVRERVRQGATTAEPSPVAAPPMTAPAPIKQGPKMTPEQFRALFNPQ